MERLTFVYASHQYMSVKAGITVKQLLKILKKGYLILVGIKLSIAGKVELLNKTYFCDNHQCPWMTDNIKRD